MTKSLKMWEFSCLVFMVVIKRKSNLMNYFRKSARDDLLISMLNLFRYFVKNLNLTSSSCQMKQHQQQQTIIVKITINVMIGKIDEKFSLSYWLSLTITWMMREFQLISFSSLSLNLNWLQIEQFGSNKCFVDFLNLNY